MSTPLRFDVVGALGWVKSGIDDSLAIASQFLCDLAENSAENDAGRKAAESLHQAAGALQLLGLEGCSCVVREVEKFILEIPTKENIPNADSAKSVIGALMSLSNYLIDVANGQSDIPSLLYPRYEFLAGLNGRTDISMSELFFPPLDVLPPPHPDARNASGDELAQLVATERAEFQRGLIAWLRGDQNGLGAMSRALAQVEQLQGDPNRRAFWWIAGGLVDLLQNNSGTPAPELKKLFSRIDRQFARLAGGEPHVAENLLRDMLFWIGQEPTNVPRALEIQQHYELLRLTLITPGSDVEGRFFEYARGTLDATQAAWSRYNTQMNEDVASVRVRLRKLPKAIAPLHNSALDSLSRAMARAAEKLPPRASEAAALAGDITMALARSRSLLADLENALSKNARNSDAPPKPAIEMQKPVNEEAAPVFSSETANDTLPTVDDGELSRLVAHEMRLNLSRAEEILERFFQDHALRGTLKEVFDLLQQVHGALELAGPEDDLPILGRCLQAITEFKSERYSPSEIEIDALVHDLSSLNSHFAASEKGESNDAVSVMFPPSVGDTIEVAIPTASVESQIGVELKNAQALLSAWDESPDDARARTELRDTLEHIRSDAELVADSALEMHAEHTLAALEASVQLPSDELVHALATMTMQVSPHEVLPYIDQGPQHQMDGDDDMLGVFLDEARDVVSKGLSKLDHFRNNPSSIDSLTEIRRGFHTLKGSSRMVQLTDFGDVAWTAEEALNRWLERGAPTSEALLEFVHRAYQHFSNWIESIASKNPVEIDKKTLAPEALSLTFTPVSDDEDEAELESANHEIVDTQIEQTQPVQVSSNLREIFLTEAAQLLTTLQDEINAWGTEGAGPPSEPFVRAAHTLAGISRSTAQPNTAGLAAALEQWVLQLVASRQVAQPAAVELMNRTYQQLATMVGAFRDGGNAIGGEELIHQIEKAASPAAQLEILAPAVEQTSAATTEGSGRRNIKDDLDDDLLPVFLEEAETLIPVVGESLRTWKAKPSDFETVQALQRALHTFKGSARMVGALRLGELVHQIESEVNDAAEGLGLTPELYEALQSKFDRVNDAVDRLLAGEKMATVLAQTRKMLAVPSVESGATLRMLAVLEREETLHHVPRPQAPDTDPQISDIASKLEAAIKSSVPANDLTTTNLQHSEIPTVVNIRESETSAPVEQSQSRALIRVAADDVDTMVNQAGEVNIARTRVENEMRMMRGGYHDLTQNILRLRQQLREIEIQAESQLQSRQQQAMARDVSFDPLEFDRFTRFQELTRMMAESVNDIGVVQQSVLKSLDEADAALLSQARTSFDLQQQLMGVRMVPFANVADRFYRIVRVTARELGKRAELDLQGAKVELDRGVLERITAPMEHLLRNALAHGIELPVDREAVGKAGDGRIQIELEQQGNDVVINLSDDGKGINVENIERIAIARGVIPAQHNLSRRQLIELIFTPGFSTASQITELAGRGVGLDVVRSEITALGGRVEVSSEFGKGTRFTIYLPLTLAIAEALLVRAGNRQYALPTTIVRQVQRFTPEALAVIQSIRELSWGGEGYRFIYLLDLFGQRDASAEERRFSHVILLRSGGQRLAVQVDELIGIRQVVVKSIGPQLAMVSGLVGATVLANGEIVLIVNPVTLGQGVAAEASPNITQRQLLRQDKPNVLPRKMSTIMVVDDSITVRKISERTLSREGYQVVLAKDGLDALEKIRDTLPDVMLVDIEMPRMDGFDLTRSIRANPITQSIPIIMITSRTAEKHRRHAMQLGVNIYLGKPYTDEDLLKSISTLMGDRTASDSLKSPGVRNDVVSSLN